MRTPILTTRCIAAKDFSYDQTPTNSNVCRNSKLTSLPKTKVAVWKLKKPKLMIPDQTHETNEESTQTVEPSSTKKTSKKKVVILPLKYVRIFETMKEKDEKLVRKHFDKYSNGIG